MLMRSGPIALGGAVLVLGGAAVLGEANAHLPGNQQGYQPDQPIRYSHRMHAGEMQMDCRYCHFAAETGRHAGVPPAQVCMNCHGQVTAGADVLLAERKAALDEKRDPRRIVSDRLRPLYDALAIGDDGKPDSSRTPRPIAWVRIHDLPDFVAFDHSVHVTRGVACQACHGPVEAMEQVRQEAPLTMGWCVECHRANGREGGVAIPPVAARAPDHVSVDCAACHY
ncbi:MAG: cytochrome c family protein [Planctomycetes bacterium]|nr:cytochrome c family protein [Planctomycetota bacterium]